MTVERVNLNSGEAIVEVSYKREDGTEFGADVGSLEEMGENGYHLLDPAGNVVASLFESVDEEWVLGITGSADTVRIGIPKSLAAAIIETCSDAGIYEGY